MKRILVTGAGGFIGKAVVQVLENMDGTEVHAVYNKQLPVSPGKVIRHQCNLLDTEQTEQLIATIKPSHLLQLAWCSEHGVYWKDPANIEWMSASLQIAASFLKHGGERAVFAGTSAEYEWPGAKPFNEFTSPLKSDSLYGGCKLGLFWALSNFFEQQKKSWAWARLFNPFGAGEDPRRLIPKTCLRLLRGETINFDSGSSIRDFLHVQDAGSALAKIVDSQISGPVNIGSGIPLSVRNLIEHIALAIQSGHLVHFEEPATNVAPDWVVADTGRLNAEYKWQPEKSFQERIYETCQWWANNYKKQTSIL